MIGDFFLHALLGLLPVCCFLAALMYLDSYKLIPMRWILGTIALGCGTAIVSYPLNIIGLEWLDIGFVTFSRYAAPVVEEALKALVIIMLVRRNRIGFLVDAAIFGFAVGTGFAIFENLFYLQALPDTKLGTWIVRGFGTAFMHGGTTAIFAIVSHTLAGQKLTRGRAVYIPGFVIAVIVHSVFNHFFFAPIVNTLLILVSLPILLAVVFQQSEKSVSEWLGMGFDADAELLELINSGELSTSKVGKYLHSLKEKFEGPVVVDLLCYLRLHAELSMRAKGLLMMRESGFANKTGEETKAKLEELKFLESSIGPTGLLAMKPFLEMSQKDLWQLYMLSN
ncbi:MAG: PrsW family intramembrane metalloprotease [Gammaproteobacteria bacterium]|nr:PrsW family intramembrane metalloprotease [Gammaproteobacteria bacterium]MDH3480696.1 PrsW family intramembrane metalloprotease [Gammaproteobacteria bacterium]